MAKCLYCLKKTRGWSFKARMRVLYSFKVAASARMRVLYCVFIVLLIGLIFCTVSIIANHVLFIVCLSPYSVTLLRPSSLPTLCGFMHENWILMLSTAGILRRSHTLSSICPFRTSFYNFVSFLYLISYSLLPAFRSFPQGPYQHRGFKNGMQNIEKGYL